MARELKDGVRETYYLEKELAEKLKNFCEATGRTKTKVVEFAIRDYLEKHTPASGEK